MHVLALGEAMVELSLDAATPNQAGLSFAGDTLNTAIYLKRAAPDLSVGFGTKLGQDVMSDRMVALMQDEALETSVVLRSPDRMPGLYAISTDDRGERSFLYWRDRSAARQLMDAPGLTEDMFCGVQLVYLSAITLAILPPADRARLKSWLRRYQAAGGRVAFDSNYRPALWPDRETAQETVEDAWRLADIGLPSVDDEIDLFGDVDADAVLARLNGWGVTQGALKRGSEGPVALDGTPCPPQPQVQTVVDSTAAGDSFNAGYLAALLQGGDPVSCMTAGHRLAAKVITHRGALIPREAM